MLKRPYGIAVAATALAMATGLAAFAASASSASATTVHTNVHKVTATSAQSSLCPSVQGTVIFGKCINSVKADSTPMRQGPGPNVRITADVASASNAIADYCVVSGLSGSGLWDLVYDPLNATAGFIPEADLKAGGTNTGQAEPC